MLLTVTQLRQHVTSGLGDDALQRLLEVAENDITAAAGDEGAQTEYQRGGFEALVLDHPMGTATSVTERAEDRKSVG